MTERDITICGHGSNTPSLKNLYEYNSLRYSGRMSNGVRKGLLRVRRLKALDTPGKRDNFRALYGSILGRNVYDQNRRQYVYTPYRGRYYSDCSSSGCATYQRCGCEVPLLNTAAMLGSDLFEDVNCEIVNGHIQHPERLKVGDALLYAGNINRPSLSYVGHVEYIYDVPWLPGSGWSNEGGEWQYIEYGEPVRDEWRYIDGRWYVFDAAGRMIRDTWHLDGSDYYYLGTDGGMLSGRWLDYRGDWYYLDADGRMVTDAYVHSSRGWCYINEYGQWDDKYIRDVPKGPGVHIVGEQDY